MDELKRCPFCGGKARLYETDFGGIKNAMIECKNCRATIECDSINQKTATKRAKTKWSRRADGWVSVKDRLPDGEPVLAYNPAYLHFKMKTADYVGGTWKSADGRTMESTHWMPLPQPPKEGE